MRLKTHFVKLSRMCSVGTNHLFSLSLYTPIGLGVCHWPGLMLALSPPYPFRLLRLGSTSYTLLLSVSPHMCVGSIPDLPTSGSTSRQSAMFVDSVREGINQSVSLGEYILIISAI